MGTGWLRATFRSSARGTRSTGGCYRCAPQTVEIYLVDHLFVRGCAFVGDYRDLLYELEAAKLPSSPSLMTTSSRRPAAAGGGAAPAVERGGCSGGGQRRGLRERPAGQWHGIPIGAYASQSKKIIKQ